MNTILISVYLHALLFASAVGDIGLVQAFDAVARWTMGFKLLSWAMPPLETFEKRFGKNSRWTKNYEFLGDIVKYVGNLDFRAKVIELYPAYKELKPQKDLERANATVMMQSPFSKIKNGGTT